MRVVKVFNNNVVAVKKEDGTDAIVTGVGVGFQKKVHDKINLGRVQKVYTIEENKKKKLYDLMEKTPFEYIAIAESIVDKVRKELYPQMSDLGLFGLVDHISFAIERVKKGIELPNLILKETKWLYSKEYEIAQWAIDEIYQTSHVRLPSDEAGYIVLHILNASGVDKKQDTLEVVRVTKVILSIIEEELDITLDTDSFDYYRFVMHVRYLLSKLDTHKDYRFDNVDELYHLLIGKNQYVERSLKRIDHFFKNEYHVDLSMNELIYLAIHIVKLLE